MFSHTYYSTVLIVAQYLKQNLCFLCVLSAVSSELYRLLCSFHSDVFVQLSCSLNKTVLCSPPFSTHSGVCRPECQRYDMCWPRALQHEHVPGYVCNLNGFHGTRSTRKRSCFFCSRVCLTRFFVLVTTCLLSSVEQLCCCFFSK